MSSTPDVGRIVFGVVSEGASGPHGNGTTVAPHVQLEAENVYRQLYTVTQPLTQLEQAEFGRWVGAQTVKFAHHGAAASSHPALRAAADFLRELVFRQVNDQDTVLAVGSTYTEYRAIAERFPMATVHCCLGVGHDKDAERLRKGLSLAHAEADPIMRRPALEFIEVATAALRGEFVRRQRFSAISNLDQVPACAPTVVFAFDVVTNVARGEWEALLLRLGSPRCYFTMHYCPELICGARDAPIRNQFFHQTWKREGGCVVMEPGGNSSPYVHDVKIVKGWWSRHVGAFNFEAVFARAGVGAFSMYPREGSVVSPVSLRSLENVVRFPDVVQLLRYNKWQGHYVDKMKYEQLINYLMQVLDMKSEIDLAKLYGFLRGNMGAVSTLTKMISTPWELMDERVLDILLFAVLDVSLMRRRARETFSMVGALIRADTRLAWFWRHFSAPWAEFVDKVLSWVDSAEMYDLLQEYKVGIEDSALTTLVRKAALKDAPLVCGYAPWVSPVPVPDVEVANLLQAFRGSRTGYDYVPDHGAAKLRDIEVLLPGDKMVFHIGSAPGGMLKVLAERDCHVVAAVVGANAFPARLGASWRDPGHWYVPLVPLPVVPHSPANAGAPRAQWVEFDDARHFLLEASVSRPDVIFCDVACCNGRQFPGYCNCSCIAGVICYNPIAWLDVLMSFVADTGVPCVTKVSTSHLDLALARYQRPEFKVSILQAAYCSNPQSLERYWRIERASSLCAFVNGFRAEARLLDFWSAYAPQVALATAFDQFVRAAVSVPLGVPFRVGGPLSPAEVFQIAPLTFDAARLLAGKRREHDVGVVVQKRSLGWLFKKKVVVVSQRAPAPRLLPSVRSVRTKGAYSSISGDVPEYCECGRLVYDAACACVEVAALTVAVAAVAIAVPSAPPTPVAASVADAASECGALVGLAPAPGESASFAAPVALVEPPVAMEVVAPGPCKELPIPPQLIEWEPLGGGPFTGRGGNFMDVYERQQYEKAAGTEWERCVAARIAWWFLRADRFPPKLTQAQHKQNRVAYRSGTHASCLWRYLAIYEAGSRFSGSHCPPELGREPRVVVAPVVEARVVQAVRPDYGLLSSGYSDAMLYTTLQHGLTRGNSKPCPIKGEDAMCVYRTLALLLHGACDAWSDFVPAQCKDAVGHPHPPPTEVALALFRRYGVAFAIVDDDGHVRDFVDAHASPSAFGLALVFANGLVGHVDALVYVAAPAPLVGAVHPCIRWPQLPVPSDVFKDAVRIKPWQLVRHAPKQVLVALATCVKLGPADGRPDGMVEAHDKVAARLLAMSEKVVPNQQEAEVQLFVSRGVAGCGKTEIALQLVHEAIVRYGKGSAVYLAPAADTRVEFVDRYNKRYNGGEDRAAEASGFFAKTWVVAMADSPKWGLKLPSRKVRLFVLDEAFRWNLFYFMVITMLYPDAVFVFLGDPDQLDFDTNKFASMPGEVADLLISNALFGVPGVTNPHPSLDLLNTAPKAVHTSKVTQRNGPRLAMYLRSVAGGGYDFYTSIADEFEFAYVDRLENPTQYLVMRRDVDIVWKAGVPDGSVTIAAAQGRSVDQAAVVIDMASNPTFFRMVSGGQRGDWRAAALVAMTRARRKLVFVIEDPLRVPLVVSTPGAYMPVPRVPMLLAGAYDATRFKDTPAGRYADAHDFLHALPVPGALVPDDQVHPKVGANPVAPPLRATRFDVADVEFLGSMPNGTQHAAYAVEPGYVGDVKVRAPVASRTIHVETISDFEYGFRHGSRSAIQILATMIHRHGQSRAAHVLYKRLMRYDASQVSGIFKDSFCVQSRLDAVLDADLRRFFDAQAIAEMREVMKPFLPKDVDLTVRSFNLAAGIFLKTQIKPTKIETLEALGKLGQPVITSAKWIQFIWGFMFRIGKLLLESVFSDKVVWASGRTEANIAEEWGDVPPGIFVMMNDYVGHDTSQSRLTDSLCIAVYSMVMPHMEFFSQYIDNLGVIKVDSPLMTFLLLGRPSGFPCTWDINTLKQMIDMAIAGFRGPAGRHWHLRCRKFVFGGDDNAVQCDVHPAKLFDLVWWNSSQVEPLKMEVRTDGLMEFGNWLYAAGHCAYGLFKLVMKVLSKNYALVLSYEPAWEEYAESLALVMTPYRREPYVLAELNAAYYGWDFSFCHALIMTLDAYAQMSFAQAKLVLRPVVRTFTDTLGGNIVFPSAAVQFQRSVFSGLVRFKLELPSAPMVGFQRQPLDDEETNAFREGHVLAAASIAAGVARDGPVIPADLVIAASVPTPARWHSIIDVLDPEWRPGQVATAPSVASPSLEHYRRLVEAIKLLNGRLNIDGALFAVEVGNQVFSTTFAQGRRAALWSAAADVLQQLVAEARSRVSCACAVHTPFPVDILKENWHDDWVCCACDSLVCVDDDFDGFGADRCDSCGVDATGHTSIGWRITIDGPATNETLARVAPEEGKVFRSAVGGAYVAMYPRFGNAGKKKIAKDVRALTKAVKKVALKPRPLRAPRAARRNVREQPQRREFRQPVAIRQRRFVGAGGKLNQIAGFTAAPRMAARRVRAGSSYVPDLVMNMTDPKDAPGIRLVGDWTGGATATMNPFARISVPFSQGVSGTANNYLPISDAMIVTAPSMLHSNIVYNFAVPTGSYSLFLQNGGSAGGAAPNTPPTNSGASLNLSVASSGTSGVQNAVSALPIAYGLPASGSQLPFGSLLSCGRLAHDDPARYIFLHRGDVFTANAVANAGGANAPGAAYSLAATKWLPNAPNVAANFAVGTGGASSIAFAWTAPELGWYTFSIQASGDATSVLCTRLVFTSTLIATAAGARFCVNAAPSVAAVVASITDDRVIGRSVLFVNEAAPAGRLGDIMMAQLRTNDHWLNYIGVNGGATAPSPGAFGYDQLATLEQSAELPALNGAYMWALPGGPTWTDWIDELTCDEGILYDTHVPMASLSYQIMFIRIPIASGTTILNTPQAGIFVVSYAIEVQTTDTTREQSVALGSSMLMLEAQDVIRTMKQYSENPNHLAMIVENLRRVANFGAKAVLGSLPRVQRAAQFVAQITQ